MSTHSTQQQRSSSSTTAVVVVAITGLIALAGLVIGGVLLGIHATKRDGEGFYAAGAHPLSSPTRALVSDVLDVGTDGGDWLFRKGRLATLRVTATGTSDKPVFVGVATQAQINAYLHGVARDVITDFELDPWTVKRRRHAGEAVPPLPTEEHFWSASASGSGRQVVRWHVRKGDWAVAVMNADGSPGIATDISVAAKVPLIMWLGIAFLAVGAVFAVLAVAVGYGIRRQRRPAPAAPVVTRA